MSLIKETNIGVDYRLTVYHVGVAFAHEDKNMLHYGHSFRIEHSLRSGAVHIESFGTGQGGFKDWIKDRKSLMTTYVQPRRYGNKRRVIAAALDKIEQAYVDYLLEVKKETS